MKKQFLIIIIIILSISGLKAQQYHDPSYFPLAVWWQTTSVAAQYKDAGINMYVTAEQLTAQTESREHESDLQSIPLRFIADK